MSSAKDKEQIQFEKKIEGLCTELQEYTNQIDMLQDEMEHLRCRLNTAGREVDELKRQLTQRDDAIACFESKFEDLRFEFKELDKTNERVMECLQNKLAICHEQLQQKESTLIVCRNDVKSYEVSLNEARSDFVCELMQKESCLSHMKEDWRQVYEELKCKSDNTVQLERTLGELQSRLMNTDCQIKDAENKIACLLEKIQQIECQSNIDKGQTAKDIEECERKLAQSCNDLCSCQNENRKVRRCLQEQEENAHHLASEVNTLLMEIQNIKTVSCGHQERAENLENDNKEICRLLQQKVKRIKELETALCVKIEELEQCRCCVEQLEETVRGLTKSTDEKVDNSDLEAQLKLCKEKLKKTLDELEECRKKLAWAVTEMENMAKEIKRLHCEVEEAKRELSEKNSLIGDLERTIEHTEQDMENRIRRVDEHLQKYEREIKDKIHMINDCEEKCCLYQKSLSDKDVELEELGHRMCRVNCEINNMCCKVKDLEDTRDNLQKKNSEQASQYNELCQDLQCTKEQIEVVSRECGETKRELASRQRELEKICRESEELRMDLQEKDNTICRLTDERTCLSNKLSNLQCHLETETAQLMQQLNEIRNRLECEIDHLRASQMEADEVNVALTKKLSAGQRQLAQLEKCYYQKVDTFNRENKSLQTKIADKDDQLQAIKDTITLRDSEIMRLQLRICSGDRCSNNLSKGTAECSQATGGMNTASSCMSDNAKSRKRSLSWGADVKCCGAQDKKEW